MAVLAKGTVVTATGGALIGTGAGYTIGGWLAGAGVIAGTIATGGALALAFGGATLIGAAAGEEINSDNTDIILNDPELSTIGDLSNSAEEFLI